MKIAFLAYLQGFGGAEKQIIMLANAMAKRGHKVLLASVVEENCCYEIDPGVLHDALTKSEISFLRVLTRYGKIKKELKSFEPDVTVNFWYQSAYLTALMSKGITGKVIYSERGDPGDKEYKGLLGMVRKLTLPRMDGFVFQSNGAARYFDKSVRKRSTVIPNPVTVRPYRELALEKRRKVIVSVGRLHPQKNHKLLIDAFMRIESLAPEYSLEIYGDGELKEEIQRYVDVNNAEKKIVLKGTSDHVHDLIYDASIFVLSSDYEGMPNALLEAMALGIPCISTDYRPGGVREIIKNNVNGMIVPAGNAQRLADGMLEIISNPDLAERLSKNAIESSRAYAPERIYNAWENAISFNS